jgi:hypothetical protein
MPRYIVSFDLPEECNTAEIALAINDRFRLWAGPHECDARVWAPGEQIDLSELHYGYANDA